MKKYLPLFFLFVSITGFSATTLYTCTNGTVTLDGATYLSGTLTFAWSGAPASSFSNPTDSLTDFSAVTTGNYTIICTINNGNQTAKDTFLIQVCVPPTISLTTPYPSLCLNSSTSLTATWNGGNNYCGLQLESKFGGVWIPVNTSTSLLQYCDQPAASTTFQTNTITVPGTYTYRVIDACAQGCGNDTSNEVSFIVTEPPIGIEIDTTFCSAAPFTLAPMCSNANNVNYNWTVGSSSGSGNLFGNATNSTLSDLTLVYAITPTLQNSNCVGNVFYDTIYIRPEIQGTLFLDTLCNGGGNIIQPLSVNVHDDIIYRWSRPGLPISISDTITDFINNNTSAPVNVTYTITPQYATAPQCFGNQFYSNYTLYPTINPSPASIDLCSDTNILYVLNSNIPTGVNYPWERVSPAPSQTGSNTISALLSNTTNTPVNYDYEVRPYFVSAPQCTGSPYHVNFLVQPKLIGNPFSDSVCSGTIINLNLTSNFATGVTYNWVRTNPPPVLNSTGNITDNIINNALVPFNYVYEVTPQFSASPNCKATPVTVTYTAMPKPAGIDTVYSICAGSTANIPIVAIPASTVVWQSDNGASGNSSSINISIPESFSKDTTYTYIILPTSLFGCQGSAFQIQTSLHPLPPIPSINQWQDSVCLQSQGVTLSINLQTGFSYQWNLSPAVNYSYQSEQAVTFTSPNSGSAINVQIQTTSDNTGCVRNTQQTINLIPLLAPQGGNIILVPSNELVYLDNTSSNYQWGYDNSSLQPTYLTGETFQSYQAGNSLDTTNNFYWIVITDENGCTNKIYYNYPSFSNIFSNNSFGDLKDITILPNPSETGWFSIVFAHSGLQTLNLRIYDTQGRLIKDTNENNFYLNKGVYLAEIRYGKDKTKRFGSVVISTK